MRFSMLVLAVALMAGVAQAQEAAKIPYVKNNLCHNNRAHWDAVGFCVVEDGKEVTYPKSDMGEIKLKDSGNWVKRVKNEKGEIVDNPYVTNLSDESAAVVDGYNKYYVRYLTYLPEDKNKISKFVVHVFFNVGPSTQTIYVYGEMLPNGDVRYTGYQNSQGIEGDARAILGAFTVLPDIIGGNGNAGAKAAQNADRTRIEPAKDVLKTYRMLKKEGKDVRIDRP